MTALLRLGHGELAGVPLHGLLMLARRLLDADALTAAAGLPAAVRPRIQRQGIAVLDAAASGTAAARPPERRG